MYYIYSLLSSWLSLCCCMDFLYGCISFTCHFFFMFETRSGVFTSLYFSCCYLVWATHVRRPSSRPLLFIIMIVVIIIIMVMLIMIIIVIIILVIIIGVIIIVIISDVPPLVLFSVFTVCYHLAVWLVSLLHFFASHLLLILKLWVLVVMFVC